MKGFEQITWNEFQTISRGECALIAKKYKEAQRKDPKFAAWIQRRRKMMRSLFGEAPPHKTINLGKRDV
jgi:hypothetical protein